VARVSGDVSKIDAVLAEHEKFKQAELERGEAVLAEAMNSVRDLIDCGPTLEHLDYAVYAPSRFTGGPDPDRFVHQPFPDEEEADEGLWEWEEEGDREPWEPDERIWRMPNGLTLRNVHDAAHCFGQACVIHNPSTHHMRFWPITWRSDSALFERRCAHGVGHPDPDQFEFWERSSQEWKGVHGCDGCCRP
jgi:hypothetical protein